MIAQARSLFPQLRFEFGDGADFHVAQPFDAVFSNAAIHWMIDQAAVACRIWQALKPGGRFVAEFGGKLPVKRLCGSPQRVYIAQELLPRSPDALPAFQGSPARA